MQELTSIIEKPVCKAVIISPDECYGKFAISPLERGFGITLGNSMRRVLLSNLPGVAVTSVKFDGISHEFTSIPGVREDVTEIILNLKGVSAKLHSEGSAKVQVEVTGPCEMTAKDLSGNSDIEIQNPDWHIATLDAGGKITMEVTFNRGRGYVPAERNKELINNITTLPVDSIYTPVLKCNFSVSNARVGNIVDYDNLELEVWTDGTCSAKDAVMTASEILMSHFALFENIEDLGDKIQKIIEEKDNSETMNLPIECFELSTRAYNCLRRAGVEKVGNLTEYTEEDCKKLGNVGEKTFAEIKARLEAVGLSFKKEP